MGGVVPVDVAPDLIQPVIGFRRWMLVGEQLVSPLARTPWRAGTMQAECLPRWRRVGATWRPAPPHTGPAPDPACACGLYALHAPGPPWLPDGFALVRGAVALWGRLEVHQDGMRAEFARVVALALPPLGSRRTRATVRRTACSLGVEAVPTRHLRAAALEHGRPLPPSLLPG